ncbi:hypothetical protein [Gloeocapsopsis dulcis]|uniref:Transcription factor RcaD n=1 Tax=Gloeocapsopsis dulcis AAB1 = 1H9 TaxID=1433147 RepID=A0A6N8FWN9_9CHRO|nr:hypothetical protein [Gloeocapsopsis dulcis]MUL37548.1 hypothetical protein [Gloeocapsopsis dulcis AAB1 = 1H9]WNN87962.1 hypothetical protein P0S91_16845 [Gloeocapsopsis dulcis]
METIELKFLLRLLGFTDYRTTLTEIKLGNNTKVLERNKICRQLCDRGLVECSYEVTKLKIAPPGKALLKLPTSVPVTDNELKVLKASENKKISPGEAKIPTAERQAVIQGLADRGLIEVENKVKDVWLSEQGKAYLRDDYVPKKGVLPVLSLDLFNNYIRFMRKFSNTNLDNHSSSNGVSALPTKELGDLEVLQTIQSLDQELGTENYLPIFHLRQKLETVLSRNQLDQVLYRLQRNDQIELSSLQEVTAYTPEQIDAGIPQDIGGPLFFIAVN